jgi:hypothetical protein
LTKSGPDLFPALLTEPQASSLIFRGQPQRFAKLQPSIERLDRTTSSLFAKEEYIRREFMRRAPHYLQKLPNQEDTLAWFALARHHGAPSRLLDWSRSLPVAAFFAASEATVDEGCIIWAIDQRLLKQHALEVLKGFEQFKGLQSSHWEDLISHGKNFEDVFLQQSPAAFFIAPLEPFDG